MADKEEDSTNSSNNDENGKAVGTPEGINEEVPHSLEPASSGTNTPSTEAPPPPNAKEKKIELLLKATGDAPIMTKKKWSVDQDKTIGWISGFIKKFIKLGAEERLFLYINQSFAPAPDQTVKNLYDCYGTDGKLIIHYCKNQAWG